MMGAARRAELSCERFYGGAQLAWLDSRESVELVLDRLVQDEQLRRSYLAAGNHRLDVRDVLREAALELGERLE